jgi:decaprenylphospho-beta-D-erythro-pentofuranosid-2-ulose 2-reductase
MPTVLLLGASSDIGYAIAEKFAAHQFGVQLAGRSLPHLQTLQSDLNIRFNVPVSIHSFDAVSFSTHHSFYEQLNPKPDITICAFGYMEDNEKAFADWAITENIIHTNYTGAVSILNIIAADYASRKTGIIAGISSVAGERGRQGNFIYGSAKAGFTAYLSGLRNRFYPDGVHVLTVLPGFVKTKMTAGLSLPAKLTATPEQVAVDVFKAIQKKKNIIYTKWFWKWIMLIIKNIPESIFKKKKL